MKDKYTDYLAFSSFYIIDTMMKRELPTPIIATLASDEDNDYYNSLTPVTPDTPTPTAYDGLSFLIDTFDNDIDMVNNMKSFKPEDNDIDMVNNMTVKPVIGEIKRTTLDDFNYNEWIVWLTAYLRQTSPHSTTSSEWIVSILVHFVLMMQRFIYQIDIDPSNIENVPLGRRYGNDDRHLIGIGLADRSVVLDQLDELYHEIDKLYMHVILDPSATDQDYYFMTLWVWVGIGTSFLSVQQPHFYRYHDFRFGGMIKLELYNDKGELEWTHNMDEEFELRATNNIHYYDDMVFSNDDLDSHKVLDKPDGKPLAIKVKQWYTLVIDIPLFYLIPGTNKSIKVYRRGL